jgi:hypothetical protein
MCTRPYPRIKNADSSSNRKLFRGFLLLLGMLSVTVGRAGAFMKFEVLTYTVGEMMGPPQKLTIQADGEVRYESHSNLSSPATPEIGIYATKLSPAEMELLDGGLDNPPFQSLPDHRGRIAAGDRYQRISLASAAGTFEKMVGTSEPIDPGLASLLSRLHRILTIVIEHPIQGVRMTVLQSAIDGRGAITVDFELSGMGTEAIQVVNPLKLENSPGLSMRGRPDKPAASYQSGEVFSIRVDKITGLGAQGADADSQVLQLGPREARSYRATAGFTGPSPQTYLLRLVYQNTTQYPSNQKVLIGELFSKVIALRVPALSKVN